MKTVTIETVTISSVKKRVFVVGATGYIGKFVVRELVGRGYDVVSFVRERSGIG
ncbi:MAG: NmrA family NAD(P)-binding protein, partial [Chlorobiaceae bacterium]